jgi:hypothetical protein
MYNNQDHSMLTAILAIKDILGKQHGVWSVNTERSYHEEVGIPHQNGHVKDILAQEAALDYSGDR